MTAFWKISKNIKFLCKASRFLFLFFIIVNDIPLIANCYIFFESNLYNTDWTGLCFCFPSFTGKNWNDVTTLKYLPTTRMLTILLPNFAFYVLRAYKAYKLFSFFTLSPKNAFEYSKSDLFRICIHYIFTIYSIHFCYVERITPIHFCYRLLLYLLPFTLTHTFFTTPYFFS